MNAMQSVFGKKASPRVRTTAIATMQQSNFRPYGPGGPRTRSLAPMPMPVSGILGTSQRFFPGGKTGYTCERPPPVPVSEAPPELGMRPNKTSYFLKNGTYIEEGTVWVKARRRNALNPRAFDRALSRITSAKRFGTKLGRVTVRAAC